jgi:putative transposase
MVAHRLSIGVRFVWNSNEYEVKRLLSGRQANIENLLTGEMSTVPLVALEEALFAGNLSFEVTGKRKRDVTHRYKNTISNVSVNSGHPAGYNTVNSAAAGVGVGGDSSGRSLSTMDNYMTMEDVHPRLTFIAHFRLWAIRPLLQGMEVEYSLTTGPYSSGSDFVQRRTRAMVTSRAQEIKNMHMDTLPAELRETSVSLDDPNAWSSSDRHPSNQVAAMSGVGARVGRKARAGANIKSSGEMLTDMMSRVSTESLYRWLHDYRQGGYDLRALIPAFYRCGSKDNPRLPSQVDRIINTVIQDNLKSEQSSIDCLHQIVASYIEEINQARNDSEQLPTPSRSTIARRIAEVPTYEQYAARHGNRAAHRKYQQYTRTQPPSLPNTLVEVDSTMFDCILIDESDNLPLGRPALTMVLDLGTRCIMGYSLGFEQASYLSVMEALYHAIRPKGNLRESYGTENNWCAYGVPIAMRVDNGKAYRGKDLRDACNLLGIDLQFTPVRTPHYKGAVEQLFRTADTMLVHTLPGTTFSDTRSRGDYNSKKEACLSLDDVQQLITTWAVDIYMQSRHSGIEAIPARAWERAVTAGFEPRLPASALDLRVLLARVAWRSVQHYGIEFETLVYNCRELGLLRARLDGANRGQGGPESSMSLQVKIKYDPSNLGSIYVYDPFDGIYLEVPAQLQEYAEGLSLWKHRIIRANTLRNGDKPDAASLGRNRRRLQNQVAEARERHHSKKLGLALRHNFPTGNAFEAADGGSAGSRSDLISSSRPQDTEKVYLERYSQEATFQEGSPWQSEPGEVSDLGDANSHGGLEAWGEWGDKSTEAAADVDPNAGFIDHHALASEDEDGANSTASGWEVDYSLPAIYGNAKHR